MKVKGFKNPEKAPTGRRRPWAIKVRVLKMIMEAARETYPNEFSGALRAEGGIIIEVVMLPGTLQGEAAAILQLHMLPANYGAVGTVHSHPSGVIEPSEQDLRLFDGFGYVHIIAGEPFDADSWRAFDALGKPYQLQVIE
jgi:proteasome lid subunit RPN8/RPN11